ncbi:MAG TPA: NADP-dependent oxidoreductase [Steroidobacteraceae bacterium]|nr:NADP-dependent oxidoreductase [Steroidobacteraceae bacterium]
MSSAQAVNRRIVLARRPEGEPTADDFRLEKDAVPAAGAGQLLLRTRYLSLDPYMRGRMSDARSYAPPVVVGEPMTGQTVSVVEASHAPGFEVGDLVLAIAGWQDYVVVDAQHATKIDPSIPRLSYALGVLGMPGLTAYVGLLDIGQPQPGETVVVAAATGAVGSVVGQLAKLKGCRAVGIAGGTEKCEYAVQTLGFDACIDHRAADFREQLTAAAPRGIDVYFENVGGAVLTAVVPLLNVHARVPLCGLIAWYNLATLPEGPDRTPWLLSALLRWRIKVQGFIIFDHLQRLPAFYQEMSAWVREGKVKYREEILEGLEQAPQGLIGLLRGENFGKLLVQVSGS